jgi:hypothetical protein
MESQIDERARLDSAMVERAYAELASSVINSNSAPQIGLDDIEQTDGAVKACLKFIRVEPGEVPEGITDKNERIDWLCRPSGTMHRLVQLDEGWYKRAFGALLGHLDTGDAVALLPRGMGGYYFLEPGSGRKVRVDAEVASHIASDAVFFYKPLPARPLKVRDLDLFIHGAFEKTDYLLVIAAALADAEKEFRHRDGDPA